MQGVDRTGAGTGAGTQQSLLAPGKAGAVLCRVLYRISHFCIWDGWVQFFVVLCTETAIFGLWDGWAETAPPTDPGYTYTFFPN